MEIDALVLARRDVDHLGARVQPGAVGRPVDLAGGEDERRCEAGVEEWAARGDASARVEQHAQRLAIGARLDMADGQGGEVAQRGAGADHDRLRLAAQGMGVAARGEPGDPARRAVGGGGAAVETDGCLEQAVGAAGAALVQVGRERGSGFGGAHSDRGLDAACVQVRDAAAGDAWVGVEHADHDARDAGGEQGVDARRGAAMVGARLEADIGGGAGGVVAGGGQSEGFGVWLAGAQVKALADDAVRRAR